MTIKKVTASLLAVFALGTVAMAQGGQNQPPRDGDGMKRGEGRGFSRRMGRRAGGMREMMNFSRLNLTDAQKQRIQALRENSNRSREANQARMQEMSRLMRLKAVGLLTTEQGTRLTALQAQMKTDADRMRSELLAVLTPEQRVLAEQMLNSRGVGRGGMRGGRMMRQNRQNRINRPGRPDRPAAAQTPPAPVNN